MPARVTHTVKAAVRDPQGVTRYLTVGRAVTGDDGRIALKIDTLPYDLTKWTGWLNLYTPDPKGAPATAASQFDDDIPF